MTLATAAAVIAPVPLLFPGKRQLLPQGMAGWEPDAGDDGDVDDLRDDPDDGRDERPEPRKPAA